jgi:hypothetical protein
MNDASTALRDKSMNKPFASVIIAFSFDPCMDEISDGVSFNKALCHRARRSCRKSWRTDADWTVAAFSQSLADHCHTSRLDFHHDGS